MNTKTFARLMLFLSFFTLIGSLGYFMPSGSSPDHPAVLEIINSFWNSIAVYWIIPYGILIIYLLIWSRKKTAEDIRETFSMAPIMLMFLVVPTYLVLAIYMSAVGEDSLYGGEVGVFMVIALISIPAILIVGYAFIGSSILIYELFKKLRFIQD